MCRQRIQATFTQATFTQVTFTLDMRTPDTCTGIRGIGVTCTRDTSGAVDITAGTDMDTTGVADDMLDPTRVQGGRRGDGHTRAGTAGGGGTGS